MATDRATRSALPERGSILNIQEVSDLVFDLTVLARRSGCIPIAAAVLRPVESAELFKVEGYGHNELGWGRPFVHGETGAFQAAGAIDYRGTVLVSSLSPCEFCQGCAAHLGIREVWYLDALNFVPDQSGFDRFGIKHSETRHQACYDHFADWLKSDAAPGGRNLWHQDIGSYIPDPPIAIDFERLQPAMNQVLELMRYAASFGEFPCGALVVDAGGDGILGYGPGSILRLNDPTAVPEIFAGRQCGARTRWDRTIFISSSPPSQIALGMYRRWGVKNVVILDPVPISAGPYLGKPSGEVCFSYAPKTIADAASKIIGDWLRVSDKRNIERLSVLYGGVMLP